MGCDGAIRRLECVLRKLAGAGNRLTHSLPSGGGSAHSQERGVAGPAALVDPAGINSSLQPVTANPK